MDDTCFPTSLGTVLKHWHVDVDLNDLADYLVVKHVPRTGVALEYLDRIPKVASIVFTPDTDSIKALLRKGYPIVLMRSLLREGEVRGHASVVVGFDDLRGVFLILDPNWSYGWTRLPYSRIASCFAILIGPKERVLSDGSGLPDQEYHRLRARADIPANWQDLDRLQRDLDAAFALKQDDPLLYAMMAGLRDRRHDSEGAKEWYRRGSALKHQSAWFWRAAGDFYWRAQAYAEAEFAYRQAIELEPDYIAASAALAMLHVQHMWDQEACLAETKELVERADRNGRAHAARGAALFNAYQHDDAERELLVAIRRGAGPEARWYLAINYARQERYADAIQSLEEYQKQRPGTEVFAQTEPYLVEWRKRQASAESALNSTGR